MNLMYYADLYLIFRLNVVHKMLSRKSFGRLESSVRCVMVGKESVLKILVLKEVSWLKQREEEPNSDTKNAI